MKLFQIIPLVIFSLLINKYINAQTPELKYKLVKNCGIDNEAKFYIEFPSPDTFLLDSFYINTTSLYYNKYDTVSISLACGINTLSVETFGKGLKNKIFKNFSISRNCPPLANISVGLLDSASQLASVDFSADNSKYDRELLSIELYQKYTSVGKYVMDTIKEFTANAINGTLSLNESIKLKPGKYYYKTTSSFSSCAVSEVREFWIGNINTLRVDEEGFIYDSIYYWHRAGSFYCQLLNWWDNGSCIDTNAFFYNPDSCSARRYWQTRSSYSAPAIKEAIYYDFNSDGIIDSTRAYLKTANWFSNSENNAIRIPAKYAQGNLTVWSRDSLGQWQSSNPTPYTNCAEFTRHDKLDFEPYYGECTFSSNGEYKADDSLNVVIKKIIINDTTFFPVDRFTFQANLEVFKNLDYGMYVVERITNNTICDYVLKDTVFSCLNFQNIVTDSVFKDSVIITNGLKHSSDSILILITDTLNNWTLVDSFWLRAGEKYVRTFPNGNYGVEYYSKNMICGKAKVHTLINSSVEDAFAKNVHIFPNPASENSNLILPFKSGNYKIIDFTGRSISKGSLVEGINEISLANLPKGLYIIEINHENNLLQKRLIKN